MLSTIAAIDPVTYATFIGAALVLLLTPGATMMFIIASGIAGGRRSGMAAALGISTATLLHSAAAAAGLAALVAASPAALQVIRYVGAAYLLWLAWKSWFDDGRVAPGQGQSDTRRAFGRGLLTNLLNPKTMLFVLAFLPQFADPAVGPIGQQILIFGVLLALLGLVTDSFIGQFSGLAAERLRNGARLMNRIAAILFGGLAARLVIN